MSADYKSDPEGAFTNEADALVKSGEIGGKPKAWIVGYIDWFDYNMELEQVEAMTWQEAVARHSKYPFNEPDETGPGNDPERFRQRCFDCDCMMNWIEVTS